MLCQCSTISQNFYIQQVESENRVDQVNRVIVEENGNKYIIERDKNDWYKRYFHKKIVDQVDLDGDGIQEGILQTQGKGNCCGPTFFVIKRV